MKKKVLAIFAIIVVFALCGCMKSEKAEEGFDNSSNISSAERYEGETYDEMPGVSGEKNEVTNSPSEDKHTNDKDSEGTSENGTANDKGSLSDKEQITEKDTIADNGTETTENNEENFYLVVFKDHKGNVLKEQKVKEGENAEAPEAPVREGFVFVKWDTYYKEVKTDMVVTAVYEELTEPTLLVETVKTKNKEVAVKVTSVNNPGLLALALKINYDESVMTLKKVDSGGAMMGYTFTGPRNKKSGCNAAWNVIEMPEKVADGEIAILYFEIAPDAKEGEYAVSVSCYDGAFDENYEPVDFNIINGSVNII